MELHKRRIIIVAVIICNIFCCHATITELDDVNFVEYENKRLQKFLGHRSSQERGVAGNDIRHRSKRAVDGLGLFSTMLGAFGLAMSVASLLDEVGQYVALNNKLDQLKISVDQIENEVDVVQAKLAGIQLLIQSTVYELSFNDIESAINICYEGFKNFLSDSSSSSARHDLLLCTEKRSAMRSVATILKGQGNSVGQDPYIKWVIQTRGYCNGTEITMHFKNLLRLFVEGCLGLAMAEQVQYGNASTLFQTECSHHTVEINNYMEGIYDDCAGDVCSDVRKCIAYIDDQFTDLTSTNAALYDYFPWFNFTVLQMKSSVTESNTYGNLSMSTLKISAYSKFYYVIWTDLEMAVCKDNLADQDSHQFYLFVDRDSYFNGYINDNLHAITNARYFRYFIGYKDRSMLSNATVCTFR